MPKVLAISSQVSCGHVGLSAIVPALQALQQQIIALPTILLSNHPGHAHVSGSRMEPSLLNNMLEALDKNGWLEDVETVLAGYCPTADHVHFAKEAITLTKLRTPKVTVICDPIIGDEAEGIYIDQAAAAAIHKELVPAADILLPNAFELGWLSGKSLSSTADTVAAARDLPVGTTVVTSVPWADNHIANLEVTKETATAAVCKLLARVPKGTGDFFSGVFAQNRNLGLATARTRTLIEHSLGQDHLSIATASQHWLKAEPDETITV
ncbi:MAG: bifunctional hydroxymethylpyrimidine kinase/phosphomethylpyrimidine kinase [Pseudomonadota bacterium]